MSEFGFATLLSPAYNFAVVQLPGRQYPGVVFQGDTLNAFEQRLRRIIGQIRGQVGDDELFELEELCNELAEVRSDYELILAQTGFLASYKPQTKS